MGTPNKAIERKEKASPPVPAPTIDRIRFIRVCILPYLPFSNYFLISCSSLFARMALNVDEYLLSSSVHGLRYLSKAEHPVSRLFWAAAVTLFILAAAFWISSSTSSWDESPYVIRTFPKSLLLAQFVSYSFNRSQRSKSRIWRTSPFRKFSFKQGLRRNGKR